MRKEVPLLITFFVGIIVMLAGITTGPVPGIGISMPDLFRNHISPWMTIVSAFALGLSSVNLALIHSRNVQRKGNRWVYSLVLLVTMAVYAGFRAYVEVNPSDEGAASSYALIYDYILSPLMSGQWACLAYYVASASYRAFRARTLEAGVLLASAVLVMLGAAPVGSLIWSGFPTVQRWLLQVPNMTGQRGIIIGAAIGSFITSLRTLLGIERGHFGGSLQ